MEEQGLGHGGESGDGADRTGRIGSHSAEQPEPTMSSHNSNHG
jgi:hypothetical protein